MDIVFNALKKIPGMTDGEAHEVASKFNRLDEISNKADKRDTATGGYRKDRKNCGKARS